LVGSITLVPLILGMLNINLIMARAAQAAKSFTRTAKWMQTADYSKSVIITTAKVSFYVPIKTHVKKWKVIQS
jgi:hypothetical protein